MFDIGWSEMLVIAVLAIIVVGPKDLPKLMHSVGRWVRKARKMASEFQASIDQIAEEAELDEVKKSIHHVSNFDPRRAIQNTIDPTGTITDPPIKPDDDVAHKEAGEAGDDKKPEEPGPNSEKPAKSDPPS